MHKRHPVLAVGALIAFILTSVQVYAGGPLRSWPLACHFCGPTAVG